MTPDRFRQIADLLAHACLLLSPEGVILAANRKAARLTGRSVQELDGFALADLVAEPADRVSRFLRDCARSRDLLPGSITVRSSDGEPVSCRAEGALVRPETESGPALLFVRLTPRSESPSQFAILNQQIEGLKQEIRRRQRLEAALLEREQELDAQREKLHNANEELAVINEELQSANEELEIANEELRNQRQELLRASEAKDRFLAMLAHELRNPLAPVRTALQVMDRAEPHSPAWERSRSTVDRQVTHMARLLDDLLDVSRITTGRVRLRTQSLDFTSLVRETLEDYRPSLEAEGLNLEEELPDSPLWLHGDPTRLAQVLGNLLQNARRFTPVGGSVRVSLREEPPGRAAVLTVRDTGIGIPAEELPHIFDVFSQADRSLDRTSGGLGLGLTLVKGLVSLHRGSITACSAGEGHGAEFVVTLPLEPSGSTVTRGLPQDRQEGRLRVLVIEDNQDAADTLGDLLGLHGYEVCIAYTGPEGVEAARRFRPNVVLCDLGLPGLDGYGVARALRGDPETASTLLVAVSGYGRDEDRRRSQEAGFDHHLLKPVDPDDLRAFLSRR